MTLFPEVDRVIYQQNPLVQVLCQLQFNELLEIADSKPVEFQRQIRDEYPVFEQIEDDESGDSPGFYRFTSGDGVWNVTLATDHLALTTSEYQRWEEFSDRLTPIRQAFEESYDAGKYSRIGLRYTDIVEREPLGLESTEWHELITSDIAGLTGVDRFREHVLSHEQRTVLELQTEEDDREIRLGLMFALGESDEHDNQVALIDQDLFCPNPTRPDDAEAAIHDLHGYSGRVFQGCITQTLHEALEPEPVDD